MNTKIAEAPIYPRSSTLDLLRGLTMLIVVMAHAMQYSLLPGEESIIWMRFIRPFQMPILFLISGWAMAYSFPPRSHSIFLRKKVKRLFIPYLVWMLICYFIEIFRGFNVFSFEGVCSELLTSDFWFLRALFLIYFVVWGGVFVCEKCAKDKKWLFSFSVVLGLIIVLLLRKIDILRPTANGWFYQWFLTGYLAHLLFKKYQKNWQPFLQAHCARIAAICSGVLSVMLVTIVFCDLSQNLVAYITIPALCFLVFGIEKRIPLLINKVVTHWGNISLAIYAIHCCLFTWSGIVFAETCPQCPYCVRVIILTILWLLGCEIMYRILKQFRLTKAFLLGAM